MAATNKTEHYELPIFVSSDIPTWLGDWNTTMGDIDEALYTLSQNTADVTKAYVDKQDNALDGKITGLTTRVSTLETEGDTLDGKITTLTSKVSALETEDDTLDGKITALTSRVSTLETKVSQLQAALNNMVQYAESNSGITAGQYEKLGLYANE